MPNWCTNRVGIYANDKKEIKKIKKLLQGEDSVFDFNKIVPMPEEFNDEKELTELESARLKKKHGAVGWREWCVKNWGTKWDADAAEITEEGDFSLVYEFNTAWSPPVPLVYKIRARFPKLKISAFYDEPGVERAGYY